MTDSEIHRVKRLARLGLPLCYDGRSANRHAENITCFVCGRLKPRKGGRKICRKYRYVGFACQDCRKGKTVEEILLKEEGDGNV